MLISADDVSAAMARPAWSEGQRVAVEDIIQGLEDDLQSYLRRPLVPVVVVDEKVTYRDGKIRLSKTPLVSVEGFTIAGTPVDASNYVVESWGLSGVWSIFGPSSLLVPDPVLLVSYTGGLPGDDPESEFGRLVRSKLKRAAMRDAAQVVLEKAPGLARLSVEGTSMEFTGGAKAGEGGWLESEKASFTRFRRRIVRT